MRNLDTKILIWSSDVNNTFRTSGAVPVGGIITLEAGVGSGVDINPIIDTGPAGAGNLAAGESASITVWLAATAPPITQLGAGTKFRIEMMAPKGGTLIVERIIPKVLTSNMNLE